MKERTMARREVNVALIGQGFMGRTHSNAWSQVRKFFKPPLRPVMHTVFGQSEENPRAFARNWGWRNASTDWKKLVKSDEIDLVDVVTPNFLHAAVAKAAIAAGRNVACEKPIAGTLKEAREMAQAARAADVHTFVWYNYRRCPAVALAHRLVRRGKVGQVRHVRAVYLQDWADESVPLAWRFQKKLAGSGALGDLHAHIVDMTRFVTGREITEICGAVAETFIRERALMTGTVAGGIAAGLKRSRKKGKVTVDDAVLFLARFSGGAIATFEAARQATGNQNRNGFEINGTKGSLAFNFERMNQLRYYDATADRAVQGWTTIMCTHAPDHPYVEAWWPDAHIIGYEHGFTNQAYDILRVLAGRRPTIPIPDFADAYQTQRVLEAVMLSARRKGWVKLSAVK
jgi:predicted dehydrogenase